MKKFMLLAAVSIMLMFLCTCTAHAQQWGGNGYQNNHRSYPGYGQRRNSYQRSYPRWNRGNHYGWNRGNHYCWGNQCNGGWNHRPFANVGPGGGQSYGWNTNQNARWGMRGRGNTRLYWYGNQQYSQGYGQGYGSQYYGDQQYYGNQPYYNQQGQGIYNQNVDPSDPFAYEQWYQQTYGNGPAFNTPSTNNQQNQGGNYSYGPL